MELQMEKLHAFVMRDSLEQRATNRKIRAGIKMTKKITIAPSYGF